MKIKKNTVCLALAALLMFLSSAGEKEVQASVNEFLIEPMFELAGEFENGVAPVMQGGKWGVINKAGHFIVKPKYDEVKWFAEGMQAVKLGDKWGYIDRTGKEVIQPQYDETYWFENGMGRIRNRMYSGYVDKDGNVIIPPEYRHLSDPNNGVTVIGNYYENPYLFVNNKGEVINQTNIQLVIGPMERIENYDGFYWFQDENNQWGFMDAEGNVMVSPTYDSRGRFSDGLSLVEKNLEWEVINTKGTIKYKIPEFKGDPTLQSGGYSDKRIVIRTGVQDSWEYSWIVLDEDGEVVFRAEEGEYYNISRFMNGYASASNKHGKQVIIDRNGNIVKETDYDLISEYENEIALVFIGESIQTGRMGAIDERGNEIIPPVYDFLYRGPKGLLYAKKDGKYGVIDSQGNVKVEVKYAGLGDSADGVIAATLDGEKWGYILVPGETHDPSQVYWPPVEAKPTSALVTVDGMKVAFEAYNINGNNYFKLRDLAKALQNTNKPFEIEYNKSEKTIKLTTNMKYTEVGGELKTTGATANKIGTATSSMVLLDGEKLEMVAYNIGGNNYFKLRDLGEALNFGVTYDEKLRLIAIDTSGVYMTE
ncbi:WG repeat-containing protein [Paenibacillus sp. LHD-117]|uniref:WG repeat-containing protein n=1 Tax=Paenibacillus sp. LHD-117 TaxID=3071412 RepID=UPI0027E11DEC|nr:WG repeat-containing protein [Paenibacillus sp. LHD-117]MDQ6420471.1 WG repeat-containing protein [Paenibacillus sp. LHD-117]